MKKLILILTILVSAATLSFANSCPLLIKQANEQISQLKGADAAKVTEIQNLIADAQKEHNTGNHADSVKKANHALDMLKALAAK